MFGSQLYSPLDESKLEIRVLNMHHTTDERDPVSYSLRTISLDAEEKITYKALSYVWGDMSDRRVITVDGFKMLITHNLYQVLPYLRRRFANSVPNSTSGIDFWIDAICINQNDFEERASQVKMMAAIYSSAVEVVIWLGEANETSPAALTTVQKWAESGFHHAMQMRILMPPIRPEHMDDLVAKIENPFDHEGWQAVSELLMRPWFSRMWVMQEGYFATRCGTVLCGDEALRWKDFYGVLAVLSVLHLLGQSKGSEWVDRVKGIVAEQWADRFYAFTSWLMGAYTPGLGRLLVFCRAMKATDKRDKLYALYGFCADRDEFIDAVDYNKTQEELMCETVSKMMLKDRRANEIWRVYEDAVLDDSIELPTWVPNILADKDPNRTVFPAYTHFYPENDVEPIAITVDYKALYTPGAKVDTVGKAIRLELGSNTYQHMQELFGLVENIGPIYATGIPVLQAVARTLLADVHPSFGKRNRLAGNQEWIYEMSAAFMALALDIGASEDWDDKREESVESYLDRIIDMVIPPRFLASAGLDVRSVLFGPSLDESPDLKPILWHKLHENEALFREGFDHFARGRKLFATSAETRYLGLGPPSMEPGDVVVLIPGSAVPVILRRAGESHVLVGTCFVLGLVDGEPVRMLAGGELKLEEFVLV
jgi:hypothetical protein